MTPYNKRRKEISQAAYEEKLVALVMDNRKHSEIEYAEYYRKCKRWYQMYRGIITGNYSGFRNNISIPFIYSVIQSDVSRKTQMSFGQFPYVNFEGYAPEDEPIARKNELLISVQLEDLGIYKKAVDFFTCADLYGAAFTREGWRQDRRLEKIRVPHMVSPGMIEDRETSQWFSYFDGPDLEILDPLDTMPQPGFADLQAADWFIYRYYRDLDYLRDLVDAEIAAGEEPSFDPKALDEVARRGINNNTHSDMNERSTYYRTQQAYEKGNSRYSKVVEITERWGTVPRELLKDGETRNRRLVVLNGMVLGANSANPYYHGQKPFGHYAVGDPHFIHGVGKSELLSKLQAASNRLMNHKLDTLDLSISPAMLVSGSSGIDSNRPMHMTPGGVIQFESDVSDANVKPWAPDLRGAQLVDPQVESLWRYMQQGSGIIEDTVSGQPASREQTLGEFQGRREGAMSRLMLESRQAEEMWLEPTANRIRGMNRQYLPLPKQIRRIGSMAILDPYTGQPLPPDELEIGHKDLWPEYKARATGANQNMLRSSNQQNIIQMLSAVGANPALMAQVNWANFARQMFITFGFRNVNELLLATSPGGQANAAMLEGGGIMEQMGGGVGPKPNLALIGGGNNVNI
jgi:hypothetical protein